MQSVLADDGMTPGPDGLFLKSDAGNVNLLDTTVSPLKAWAKRADAGIKSTDDVAVIFDNEAFYMDVFRLQSRKPADAVMKALLLGESQDRVPDGLNTSAVSVKQRICPPAGGDGVGDCRV
ncbi:hypothetical protein [Burkholderia cepacia]|uniref:hypothetical protein n=1 Tax=Burkholderia cepacia TaxID=292 RepID=UPI002FE31B18